MLLSCDRHVVSCWSCLILIDLISILLSFHVKEKELYALKLKYFSSDSFDNQTSQSLRSCEQYFK